MNLTRFRERLFTFFLPVLIVGIVLGYCVWLFGTKYFWDTASLTVQVPAGSETVATLSIQAEILHYDIPIPAFLHFAIELLMSWPVSETYPLYQSLPWSQTVTCTDICEFYTIPAGPATLALAAAIQDSEASRVQLVIAPDTRGTIDLRPDIEIADVTDTTSFLGQTLPESDRQLLAGTIFTTNQYQSLITLRGSEGEFLYDILSRQSIRLPAEIDADSVARTATDGEYLIRSKQKTYRFDRFGRTPLAVIDSYSAGKISLAWTETSTQLTMGDKSRTLPGWWWFLMKDGKTYLSDGKRIVEIKK